GSVGTAPVTPGDIQVITYTFNKTDPYGVYQGAPLYSSITEEQKERAREIFEIYSSILGVQFEEHPTAGDIWVITGDIRAVAPSYPPIGGPSGISTGPMVIMNANLNFPADSPYNGAWFNIAFHEIGHSLGLSHSYDLPSIQGPGL